MLPGKPTHFTVDSTATGDAPVDVSIASTGKNVARKPTVAKKSDGIHDVSYVPPPVGDPYDVSCGHRDRSIHIERPCAHSLLDACTRN